MMAAGLRCADCRARAPDDAERCPRCGGRLLAPPRLVDRRSAVIAWYALGLTLGGIVYAGQAFVYFIAFWDRALAFFGLSPREVGAAERRERVEALVLEAEAAVPVFPEAVRLLDEHGANRTRTVTVRDVCWQAPAGLEDVMAFYRSVLPASGWFVRRDSPGSGQLGAERGQIRLLLHGPGQPTASGLVCPPGTAYVLSYTASSNWRATGTG
jgi:hypothetical protein